MEGLDRHLKKNVFPHYVNLWDWWVCRFLMAAVSGKIWGTCYWITVLVLLIQRLNFFLAIFSSINFCCSSTTNLKIFRDKYWDIYKFLPLSESPSPVRSHKASSLFMVPLQTTSSHLPQGFLIFTYKIQSQEIKYSWKYLKNFWTYLLSQLSPSTTLHRPFVAESSSFYTSFVLVQCHVMNK